MSAHPPVHDVPKTSPTRPKHQVTRSITEVSSTFPKLHKPHYHHHPHSNRKDHGKDRDPQSAHPNLQANEVGTRSEGVTPEESRAGSRRTSVHDLPGWEKMASERGILEKRAVKDGEVTEERERSALRAAELRNAIMGLNTLSNNTTRRLDNTYYGVLEKLSVLQSTLVSMKELASMTKQLNEVFKTESESVIRDAEIQLEGGAGFEEQQKRIGDLQQRVMAGRDHIKTLGHRVDVVKERVDGWEKAEGEWQEKTRKRLRIMWGVMAVVALLLLGLMGFQYSPAGTQIDMLKGVNTSRFAEVLPDLERIGDKSGSWTKTTMEVLGKMLEKEKEEEGEEEGKLEDDSRLRLFDEL